MSAVARALPAVAQSTAAAAAAHAESQRIARRKIALGVCLIFHLCSLFMFRKIIPFIPQIMSGD